MFTIIAAISRAYIYSIESTDRDAYIGSNYSTNMGTDIAAIDRSFWSTIISTYMDTDISANDSSI